VKRADVGIAGDLAARERLCRGQVCGDSPRRSPWRFLTGFFEALELALGAHMCYDTVYAIIQWSSRVTPMHGARMWMRPCPARAMFSSI